MQPTTIIIGAERTLFRHGLMALIGAHAEYTIVGEAGDADELRRLAEREHPDLIILDADLETTPDRLIACLGAICPHSGIVVLGEADRSVESEDAAESALRVERASALNHGAAAYLPSRASGDVLLRVLQTLRALRGCDEDSLEGAGRGATVVPPPGGARYRITEREHSIVEMVAQGLCNKEIAHRLGISTQTVKNHVSRLLDKLSLADRTQLAVYALERHFDL